MAAAPPQYRPRGGLLREMRADSLGMLDRMSAGGDPVMGARIGPFRQLVVFDPELARQVLSARAEHYPRPFLVGRIFTDAAGLNLFSSAGPAWAWRRKAMQPSFQRAPMEALAPALDQFIEAEVAALAPGPVDDLQGWFAALTIRVAASALFIRELTDEEHRHLDSSFRQVVAWVAATLRANVPLPVAVPTARNRRLRAAVAELRAWLQELIDERRRAGVGERDVLDALLTMTDPATGRALPDNLVVAEAMALLFAGYETTASAASWAAVHLSAAPEVQDRLARGEDGLAGRVINETMRLRPPGWSAARMASRTDDLGGWTVARFTTVLVAIHSIHRDPRVWPDPDRFDPDRFTPERSIGRPGSAFLPFSVGPRHCLGMRLAQMELELLVTHLYRRFAVTVPGPAEPDTGFALRVRGALPARLELRS